MDQRLFFRPWALDSFWCSCIGFSASPRTIHMLLEFWLRENQWCSCKTAGCSGKTCSGTTFPNMTWKKICGSKRKPTISQEYKLPDSNAAETSALSKRTGLSNRRRIETVTSLAQRYYSLRGNDMSEQSLTIR